MGGYTNERFSALDFPLYFMREDVIKGFAPTALRHRYGGLRHRYGSCVITTPITIR